MNDSMTGSMVLVSTLFPWNAETMSGKPVPVLIGEQPHSDLRPLSGDLQHWYFAQGVMFLTEESRDAYFAFRTPSRAWSAWLWSLCSPTPAFCICSKVTNWFCAPPTIPSRIPLEPCG